jgi:hypothetical protein
MILSKSMDVWSVDGLADVVLDRRDYVMFY